MALLNVLLGLACLLQGAVALVHVSPGMKTFSSSIKNGEAAANVEKTLYEHNTGQPGVITEQWFTGSTMDQDARIRIYIDNEQEASLDFQLLLAHGVGFRESDEAANIPWGTHRFGHAADGGIFNNFRIPFGKSFRVTVTSPKFGYLWYIIRGVENYPVVLGDLVLPSNTRLRLYKRVNVTLAPLEFFPLADIPSSSGAVFLVTLAANSSNLVFLEGCMRAFIDGSNKTTWLSSGTEDFFLSAYYFNKGKYHFDQAGLTYLDNKGMVSAYKFFESDPLLFSKSFELWWRNSDLDERKDKYGCPQTWPHSSPESKKKLPLKQKFSGDKKITHYNGDSFEVSDIEATTVTTYTWVYEW